MPDVPSPMPETDESEESGRRGVGSRARRFFSRFSKAQLIAAGSVAGAVIGVVSIVVPLAVAASITTASTETVEVASADGGSSDEGVASASLLEPVSAGLSTNALGLNVDESIVSQFVEYAVPVDAPWEELWALQSDSNCTDPRQLEWLESHGRVIPPNFVVTSITNTATGGSEIVVSDIRAQGELTPPAIDTVTVGYYTCSGGGDDGIFASLRLGVDPVAVFDDCYGDGSCFSSDAEPPTPGEPVVFSVFPGQTRTLNLTYERTVDFVGRFVATVTVDGQTSTIDLSPDASDVVSPAVTRPLPYLRIAAAAMDTICTADHPSDPYFVATSVCSVDDWRAILGAP